MQRAFDRDRFRPMVNTEPFQWLCKQTRRLEAANPEISKYRMITQILSKCPPDLSHAVKCRLRNENDFTELTTIFEEVVQSLYPPQKTFVPRTPEVDTTAATCEPGPYVRGLRSLEQGSFS